MGDDGRFSLPAAESTKLNNSGNSFRWGASPYSSNRQRSNSSINLINLDSTVVSKIEPRVFADVQSKGLASRIVKYHENESRLNRSMSTNSLYTKPGKFPIVTLQRTELPFRATKQNVSMTRIVPPEKSVFCGNTLSSLFRSNSVVGLRKSNEDISRENRPIIHPPPTESDMAPTRSVLDVLKEISRKRINSDDVNSMESTKRNRTGNDLLDAGDEVISITKQASSFKRQRDTNLQNQTDVNTSLKNQDSSKSPEQMKKRICSYNNDISSSLSSSTKRKTNESKRPFLSQTMPTYLEPYETPKLKIQKRHENTLVNQAKPDNDIHNQHEIQNVKSRKDYNTASEPYGTVPKRSQSEGTSATSEYKVAQKPRLTLFNKNYDIDTERPNNDLENNDNLDESGECSGIHFVKPKKLTSGLKNPIIERTQKSKLALMLSGLRGELYHVNDEVDTSKDAEHVDRSDATTDLQKNNPSVKIDTQKASEVSANNNPNVATQNMSSLVGLKLPQQKTNPPTALVQSDKPGMEFNVPTVGAFPGMDKIHNLSTTTTTSFTSNTTTAEVAKCKPDSSKQTDFKSGIISPNAKTAITTPILASSEAIKFSENAGIQKSESTSTSSEPLKFGTNSSSTSSVPFSFGLAADSKAMSNEKLSASPALSSTTMAQSLSMKNSVSLNTTANTNINLSSTSGNQNAAAPPSNATSNAFASTNAAVKTTLLLGTNTTVNSSQNPLAVGNKTAEKTDSSKPAGGFSFGIETSKPTPNATFTFGSSSGVTGINVNPTTATVTTSNHFTFSSGSSTSEQKMPQTVFGGSPSSNSSGGFAFGSSAKVVNSPNVSSTFAFGSKKASEPANQKSPEHVNVGGFSFSSSANSSTAVNNIAANKQFSFGATPNSKTNPMLGTTNSSQNSTNIFGNGASSAFSFASSQASNPQTSANSASNSAFNFGTSTSNNMATSATNAFSFGAASSTNAQISSVPTASKDPASPFTFGASTGDTQSTGINTASATKSTFNFGGSTSLSASNNSQPTVTSGVATNSGSSTTFNFNASSTNVQSTGLSGISVNSFSKPTFNFNAPSSSNVQTTGSQSSSTNIAGNSGSTAAFNFNAPSMTSVQSTGSPSNIFAIPQSSSTGSTDRPIRRATRRLQK
ncbi:nuclear pore complex protein DDB_G0274915 [Musca vetustissima]|uniref:nuclear pore complex protein DDB_G0274915 n=1 Tax=Musca vetustissima TaxID=27455 RepID=UPI002AB7AA28|nr:nuclear pore complex protein DDB_G0274915 [Musca vetustissima]